MATMLALTIFGCSSDRQQNLQQTSPANISAVSHPAAKPSSSPTSTQLAQSVSPTQTKANGEQTEQQKAVQVVRNYYDAINNKNYERAYQYWGSNGTASHQTFNQFKQGFANTASVQVTIGEPGRLDGAAGSIYVAIPVTLRATTVNKVTQRYQGSYTLRRVNDVPGSTPEQRTWHLYSAQITQSD